MFCCYWAYLANNFFKVSLEESFWIIFSQGIQKYYSNCHIIFLNGCQNEFILNFGRLKWPKWVPKGHLKYHPNYSSKLNKEWLKLKLVSIPWIWYLKKMYLILSFQRYDHLYSRNIEKIYWFLYIFVFICNNLHSLVDLYQKYWSFLKKIKFFHIPSP